MGDLLFVTVCEPIRLGSLHLSDRSVTIQAAGNLYPSRLAETTMLTTNARNTKAAAVPEPDDNDGLLLSFEQIMQIKVTKATTAKVTAKAPCHLGPVIWAHAVESKAAGMAAPVGLPARYLTKGLSASMPGGPGWAQAPGDLSAIDHPVGSQPKRDPLDKLIAAAIFNSYGGQPFYKGPSAAEGGIMPVNAVLLMLSTEPALQRVRKWSHVLVGPQSILSHVADVAGRYAICRSEGITLVSDFFAPAA